MKEDQSSQLYNELNKAWKSTCRIVLGGEVGELKEYAEDLKKYFSLINRHSSHISGKEVTLSSPNYCDNAKFISMEEDQEPKLDPLTINEIKDIDSILRAVSEKWEYAGNRVLGNSSFVEKSDGIKDCHYVYDCVEASKSSYLFETFACDSQVKYAFGCGRVAESEFAIGLIAANRIKRTIGSSNLINSSDIYFSHSLEGCQDVIFSFFQLGRRFLIGNLQLSKDKYYEIKTKLLEELREEVKRTKKIPSLFSMVPNRAPSFDMQIRSEEPSKTDIKSIEKAFATTFKLIFRKEPTGIEPYEKWLTNRIPPLVEIRTPFGNTVRQTKHPVYRYDDLLPERRIVNYAEAEELGKLHIDESRLTDLESVKQWISDNACFRVQFFGGKNSNIIGSEVVIDSTNVYKTYMTIGNKNVGLDYRILNSENSFGCVAVFNTQFCLKCYSSSDLKRCFELDSCLKCSDSIFCFNCEGLQEAMFCFNAKGKRHAIGNTELPTDQYRKIKDSLVEQMVDEILKKKELKWDIYNIGCGGRS